MITSPYGHNIILSPDFHGQNYDDQYENIFDSSDYKRLETTSVKNDITMQNVEHLLENSIIDESKKSKYFINCGVMNYSMLNYYLSLYLIVEST